MPGHLPKEEQIPIGQYGSSNIGQLKHVYRKGLSVRYGKSMQCIAGIHYNFSLPDSIWNVLREAESDTQSAQDYQSARYISLIRNFRRYSWLLMYLFGASPALDISFLRGREHQLESFDEDTLYLPYATSLRMSDLGYQSNAQAGLTPCYDKLSSYTDSLRRAVSTPYPDYQKSAASKAMNGCRSIPISCKSKMNTTQPCAPQTHHRRRRAPVDALIARGIQYVEARCIDINPLLTSGHRLITSTLLRYVFTVLRLRRQPTALR